MCGSLNVADAVTAKTEEVECTECGQEYLATILDEADGEITPCPHCQ